MVELLLSVPSAVKVGLIFAGILVVYRLGVPLGASIIIHALVLGLWTGTGAAAIVYELTELTKPENILLVIVIVLLNYFTECLTMTGRIERTITALKSRMTSPRLVYAGLPALIGLLPMPGGALFSAPLVASVDHENGLLPHLKVAINYWFRHIWEYWWPLYPGVVLALKYSGVPTGMFILIQAPLTLFSLCAGWLCILRKVPRTVTAGPNRPLDRPAAAAALVPIGVLVAVSVAGSWIFGLSGMGRTSANLVAMLAGLGSALVLTFRGVPEKIPATLRFFIRASNLQLGLLVVGILLFSAALKVDSAQTGATLISGMRDELVGLGVPILAVIVLVPCISGMVTGVAMGFVGASFPLVFALIGAEPSTGRLAATTTLAYASGYLGMMLSPLHLCFVVTSQYFGTRLFGAYRYILGPAAIVALATAALTAVYYFVL